MKSFRHLSPREVKKSYKSLRVAFSSLLIQRSNLLRMCDNLTSLNYFKDEKIKNLIFKLKICTILSSIGLIFGLLGLYFSYFA